MKVSDIYSKIEPLAREVERRVRSDLQTYASQKNWLVTGRVKDLDSIQDKIQTGRYQSIEEIDDLIAYSLIIDTRAQEKEAISYIANIYNVVERKGKNTIQDERVFDFDATRIYATLKIPDKSSPLSSIVFEIQIRTLLQHAWSKITHPIVYKAYNVDPRQMRLASEMMAQIESIDRNFARFKTVARGVKHVRRPRSQELNSVARMIDDLVTDNIIPKELRPRNGRRLAENILDLKSKNTNTEQMKETIREFFVSEKDKFPTSVTIYELCAIALLRANQLRDHNREKSKPIYISDELMSLYPDASKITKRVSLGLRQ